MLRAARTLKQQQIDDMTQSLSKKIQVIIAVLLIVAAWLVIQQRKPTPVVPTGVQASVFDYSGITDVRQKKQMFFDILRPIVQQENKRLAELRERLLAVDEDSRDQDWVLATAERFGVDDELNEFNWTELLRRVDIIPLELVLAQAAMESGWGESRFAQMGNNLFGQWCFTEGCGIVPSQRKEGATHEVRRFDSIDHALASYMHNLNTGHAYNSLRTLRAFLRWQNKPIEGQILAGGLGRYSERGDVYIDEIQQVMLVNYRLIMGSNN